MPFGHSKVCPDPKVSKSLLSVFRSIYCHDLWSSQLLELDWGGGPLQGEPARKRRRTKSDASGGERDEEDHGVQGGEAAASILRGESCACVLARPRAQEQGCQASPGC